MKRKAAPLDESNSSDLFDLQFITRHVNRDRFVDRTWLRDRIKAELDDPQCRIVLVTGEPGAGKTTLMASLADREPGWLRYFIRRIGEVECEADRHEGSLASFLTTIGLQFAARRPELFPDLSEMLNVTADLVADRVAPSGRMTAVSIEELIVHPFMRLALQVSHHVSVVEGEVTGLEIGRVVHAATERPQALAEPALFEPARRMAHQFPGQRVVVLLDALDELRFRDAGSDVSGWLIAGSQLPANVRFVVSSRHDDPRLDELRSGHEASLREVRIDPGSEHVRNDAIRFAERIAADVRIAQVLAIRGVAPARFVREVANSAAGNFQYLAFLAKTLDAAADELPTGSMPDQGATGVDLEWLNGLQGLPEGLDKLYGLFLIRVRNRVDAAPSAASHWKALYRPLLGILAIARAALTPDQFEAFGRLTSTGGSCAKALAALRQFLDRDQAGGYRLYHASVAEFLTSMTTKEAHPTLYCKPGKWHGRITKYALKRHRKDGTWKQADPYLRIHLAAHTAAVGRLDELVEDPRFLLAAVPAGLLSVLHAVDRTAPIARLYRQVLSMIRDGDDPGALAHLELYARQAGLDEFADRVGAVESARPWSFGWTRGRPLAVRQILGRHDGEVAAVASVRVDGRPIAISGGDDGILMLWDLVAGEAAGSMSHVHDADQINGVTGLATGELDSGEAIVVSGGSDGTLRAWNLVSRRPLGAPLAGLESAGQAIAVGTLNGTPAAVCRVAGSVRVWDLVAQVPVGPPILTQNPEVAALRGYAGRTLVAIGENNGPGQGVVHVWDIATGQPVGRPLRPEEGWINAVALGDVDGAPIVAVGDGAYGVQAWDLVTGAPRSRRFIDWEGHFDPIAVGGLGHQPLMVVGDGNGCVRLWDVAAQGLVAKPIEIHPSGEVTTLALGEAEGPIWLVSAGKERPEVEPSADEGRPHQWLRRPVVRCWASGAGSKGPTLKAVGRPIRPATDVRSVAAATVDGRPVVVIADIDHEVQLWDPFTARPLGSPLCGHHDSVRAVATVAVDGRPMAVSGTRATIRAWDLLGAVETLPPHTASPDITAIAVSSLHGRPVVVCSSWRGGTRVWDLVTGQPAGFQMIQEPKYVHSMAVGDLMGRPVVVFGTKGVEVRDLETGMLVDPPHPGHHGQITAVLIFQDKGRTLIVSAAQDRTLCVWDSRMLSNPRADAFAKGPNLIQADDDVRTMAVAELDGRHVVVCSGRSGVVRVLDLATETRDAWPGSSMRSVALGTLGGHPVAVCGGENGVQVVDVGTGQPIGPSPDLGKDVGGVSAVAVGELDGRQVGLVAAGSSVHAWYLKTGEFTSMRPITHERVDCIAVGAFRGRPVVLSGGGDQTVRVSDLKTGKPVCRPLSNLDEAVTSVGITTVAGREAFVYTRYGDIRARYLNTFEEDDEQDRAIADFLNRMRSGDHGPEFSTVDETPPPDPRMGERLTRKVSSRGRATALGMVDDVPIVISGHDDGSIDMFTVETALPLGEPIIGHSGPVTAIDYGQVHGRPVMVSGSADGTVRVWDLSDKQTIFVIHTLAWVWSLALAAPDNCVIGTEMGLIRVRINGADTVESAEASGETGCRRIILPIDTRATRACPSHAEHGSMRDVGGRQVLRFCIKGIQLGNPQYHSLQYPQGHCYVLPDRLIIVGEDQLPGKSDELAIPLRAIATEPRDTPHAYESDGCHFGIVIHGEGSFRVLCCYTRTARDQLSRAIRRSKGLPTDEGT
jgi:WD40 repeat protein